MNSQLSKRQRVSGNIINIATPNLQERLNNILRPNEEAAVLGSVLQEPGIFVHVSNLLQPGDFYSTLNGFIWLAFDRINARGQGIDLMLIEQELEAEQRCPLKGNDLVDYLARLIAAPADRNNIEHYAHRVREMALKLRLLKALDATKELVFEERDLDTLIDTSNKLMFEATEQHRVEPTDAASIVSNLWDSIEGLMQNGASPTIPTGFEEFDRLTTGATPGEVMVLAGSEKTGKTTLLLSWIRFMAKNGFAVLLFSLEMSKAEIMRLFIAMESGIPRDVLKTGQLDQQQFAAFMKASGEVQKWPLFIEDQYPSLTPTQARRQIRYHQAQHAVDVVAIDGLWLMDDDDEKLNANDRPRAVHNITRDLTAQAKQFHVPILITHQYVNLSGQGERKRPSLYDLAESSGVRRNVQMVVGLHRSKEMVGGIETEIPQLWIMADRNGRSQDEHVDLAYDKKFSCYTEAGSCKPHHPF